MKRWSSEGRGKENRVELGCRDSGDEYLKLVLWLYPVSSLVTLPVELPLHRVYAFGGPPRCARATGI